MEQRHAAAIEALRKQSGLSEGMVASAVAAVASSDLGSSSGPDPAALPWLEIMSGEQKGTKIVLPFSNSTLGRSDTASIPLDEPRASRNHAEIRFDGSGFSIADLNSTNGTIVNGTPISQTDLAFGDTITIGDLELRFSCAAAEAYESEPERAAELLESMLRTAPGYAAATEALARLRG
ncbi:MAG: FHA domain-containing protein [Geminicoccaceae bacterium]